MPTAVYTHTIRCLCCQKIIVGVTIASHDLAGHFCSDACEERYLQDSQSQPLISDIMSRAINV